jgi:hypothetical protein
MLGVREYVEAGVERDGSGLQQSGHLNR